MVYRAVNDVRSLTEDDFLDGEDVVPGLAYCLRDVSA